MWVAVAARAGRCFRCSLLAAVLLEVGCSINLLQWNPHWQCFVKNEHKCKDYAEQTLNSELVKGDIDFANVVELDDDAYKPPASWKILRHTCGMDLTVLIYNSDRWHLPKISKSRVMGVKGCMVHKDRPFIVQQFVEAQSWERREIIVVGAHYPHTKERAELRKGLQRVVNSTGVKSVVVLADTNEDIHVSSDHIMQDIQAPLQSLISSPLHTTCCSNNRFKLNMTYDRIISNFGIDMDTSVLFDDLPEWAHHGEFHKAVKATIFEPTKTSTTMTTTSTTLTSSTSSTLTRTSSTSSTSTTTTTTTQGPPFVVAILVAVLVFALSGCCMLCCIAYKISSHNQKSVCDLVSKLFVSKSQCTEVALCAEEESRIREMTMAPGE